MKPEMTSGHKTDQNENTTRKIYTYFGGSGGLYSKKFHNKRKVHGETGSERSSGAPTPCLGAAWGWPAPRGGVVLSSTVSYPSSSRIFIFNKIDKNIS
jgi:hypothetical protein